MLIPSASFVPSEYLVCFASERWQQREAASLRRAVFCNEQGLFAQGDRDAIDSIAQTIVAVSCVSGMPERVVGTVRIHEAEAGHWQGSRLAVQADYRRVAWLGSALIRYAVGSAKARGAENFTAQVQAQNVSLFRRLHWSTLEEVLVCGRPHHRMQANLAQYAAVADGAHSHLAALSLAA